VLQVFPYSATRGITEKKHMGDGYGGQILEYPVLCVQISVVYYSLVVLVSESTREFFATPVDVKETN